MRAGDLTEIQLVLLSECIMAARDPSAASARTADVMRTDVRSELESGRCRHGDPNDGSGSELPLDYRVQFAHSTLVVGVTSRSNFPAMYR